MNEPGDLIRQLPHSCGALEIKLSKSRSPQWVVVSLKDLHIRSDPLLNKNCKERRRQTAYETDDPASVYPNVRKQWCECRVGWRGGGWDGNLLGGGWNGRL